MPFFRKFKRLFETPKPAAKPPEPAAEAPAPPPKPAARTHGPQSTKAAFILVVDDEENVRGMISEFLEGAGYRVTTASDGWEAVVQSEGINVELMICDILMPGPQGSGLDAYKRLRSSAYVRPDLPIIFITGMAAEKAMNMVPQDDPRVRLAFKPVNFKQLQSLIRELIGH